MVDDAPGTFLLCATMPKNCGLLLPLRFGQRSRIRARQDRLWRPGEHLLKDPLPKNERALFVRPLLSERKATSIAYSSGRLARYQTNLPRHATRLRRVYVVVQNIARYDPWCKPCFVPLPDSNVKLDGRIYLTAVLDFVLLPVDGWLARLVAAELGVSSSDMLDVEAPNW